MKYVRIGPDVWPVEDSEVSRPGAPEALAHIEGRVRNVDSVHDSEGAATKAAWEACAKRRKPVAHLDVHGPTCRCSDRETSALCLTASLQAHETHDAGAYQQQKGDAKLLRNYGADLRDVLGEEAFKIIEMCADVIERGGYTRPVRKKDA